MPDDHRPVMPQVTAVDGQFGTHTHEVDDLFGTHRHQRGYIVWKIEFPRSGSNRYRVINWYRNGF
jgi:hypothetical protein